MSHRFYAPDLDELASDYLLADTEARHLRTVCRAKPGDPVELFDGRGLRVSAQVDHIDRRSVSLRLLSRQRISKGDFKPLSIATALPKGDRAVWLVEKCTELGVDQLIPIRTQRSLPLEREGKFERLRRTVIEACKQCGRDYLMTIAAPTAIGDLLSQATPGWLLDTTADDAGELSVNWPETVAIGPEGGWTAEEIDQAVRAGWRRVRLPTNTLRIETAAIAIAVCRWSQARNRESPT